MKLVKGEWWTAATQLSTDDNGQIQFSGFLGQHKLGYDNEDYLFDVDKDNNTLTQYLV